MYKILFRITTLKSALNDISKVSAPSTYSTTGSHNVENLTKFSYIYVAMVLSTETSNRLDTKFIPVKTIDFTASNNAVWLYFKNGSNEYTARVKFDSSTSISVTTLTTGTTIYVYGVY